MRNSSRKKFLILLLIALMLTGCEADEAQSPPPTPPATNTALPDTPTPAPTEEPTPTLTPPSPTWTPLPTLSPEEAQAKVLELLETNGGCELPCWWGITPGETSWEEVEISFTRLGSEITSSQLSSPNSNAYTIKFRVPLSISSSGYYGFTAYTKDGIVEIIGVGPMSETTNTILINNGVPDEVWLFIDSLPPPAYRPTYLLAIVYHDNGILYIQLDYSKYENINDEERILICNDVLNKGNNSILWFVSPDFINSFIDAVNFTNLLGEDTIDLSENMKLLADVSDLDENSFYEMFVIKNRDNCIETPKNIWE